MGGMHRSPTTDPGAEPPTGPGRPLALLVESDPGASEIAAGMLDLLGYEVAFAASGELGLAEAAARTPDLVLLSLDLDDVEGVEALRILRRATSEDALPVIVTSARLGPASGVVQEARSLGANHFLSRPFTVRLLRDTLSRAHPSGPVDGHEVLGTTSSSLELPSLDSMIDYANTESIDLASGASTSDDVVTPVGDRRSPTTQEIVAPPAPKEEASWTVTVNVDGLTIEAELERVVGDELHVRTWGERLSKGSVVEVRVEMSKPVAKVLRYHGEVVRTAWRLGGGRSRVAVRATVPADAVKIAAVLLSD